MEYSDFLSQAELKPDLSFIFFLDGSLDIKLGSREFAIGNSRRPEGLVINRAAPEAFTRVLKMASMFARPSSGSRMSGLTWTVLRRSPAIAP